MNSLDQFPKILAEMLLKHDFQLPIVFTMVGVNGHIFAMRFESPPATEKGEFIIVTGEAGKLRFPINSLLVDRNGKAAHIFFQSPNQPARVTSFQEGRRMVTETRGPEGDGIIEVMEKRLTEMLDLLRQAREGSIGPGEFIARAVAIAKTLNGGAEKLQSRIEEEHKRRLN